MHQSTVGAGFIRRVRRQAQVSLELQAELSFGRAG
jgi:hypothetical protein